MSKIEETIFFIIFAILIATAFYSGTQFARTYTLLQLHQNCLNVGENYDTCNKYVEIVRNTKI